MAYDILPRLPAMTRNMGDLEDELSRIYQLVNDLSDQLTANRAVIKELKTRSENVKGQATHVGTGFPLRRFNLDIADEEFSSELEKFASHLVLENQSLQHENKQISGLLKEYESTLENVMSKFRGVAHASQQHDLSLHSYYTTLLSSLQTAHSSSKLHDDTSLSILLSRLSTLLRTTLRSLGGEEVDGSLEEELAELVNGLESHPQIKDEQAEAGPGPSSSSNSLSLNAPTPSAFAFATTNGGTINTNRTPSKPPRKPIPFPGSLPGSSGGYTGTGGQADWAIEREMEIMRLEEENAALREMLSIANEIPVEEIDIPSPNIDPEDRSPIASRKGSIAVEDLEADAAREADEAARAKMLSSELRIAKPPMPVAVAGQVEMLTDVPDEIETVHDTGVVAAGGGRESVSGSRPTLSGSMLGFQSGAPPEHVIADETEDEGTFTAEDIDAI